ncbi:unnamed protein product [Fraxinus pennsylvanica]|uniref:cysteine desulfurase n=1 Tax=Fraxinus pennsylvanica TaxID=56036 RepID=A0AAD2DW32_9LAMI|nr:unnamed protein product [Fraxinus pennsylvanica]
MTSKLLAALLRRSLLKPTTSSCYSTTFIHRRPLSTAAAIVEPLEEDANGITMKGVKISGRPLYLDVQATSPVDPRVLDAMLPYYVSRYGNPHSRTHLYGWESENAVESGRAQVAALINASPKEIIFTSGATESNNISIKGVMHFYKDKKRHVITTQTEHKCVLDSCRHLQQEGFDVTYLPVKPDGLIDLEKLRESIRPDTGLISVMMVNNEIGVIQPMEEIGKICKEFNVPLHTDAAQALGKIPIDVDKMNISLMSLSGHKIYGPKGIGALYVRRRPRIRVEPQMNGGGQERGLRSGTVPTPLVVGFGAACELAMREMEYDDKRIKALQERLLDGIREKIDGVVVNGSTERRYAGNLNLSFAYVEGESLLMGLKEVAVSSGSACTSASLEPSYVLRALGVEEDMAHTSIRYGIGRFTTEEEIDRAAELTVKQVEKLREMSPLYEMVKEGIDIKKVAHFGYGVVAGRIQLDQSGRSSSGHLSSRESNLCLIRLC